MNLKKSKKTIGVVGGMLFGVIFSNSCLADYKTGTLVSEEEITDEYKLCVYSDGDVVKQRTSLPCRATHR